VQTDAPVWVEREDGELQSRVSLRDLPEEERDHVRRGWRSDFGSRVEERREAVRARP
jgi:hypothetical protein